MSSNGRPAPAPNTDGLRSQFVATVSQELSAGLDSTTPGRLLTVASSLLDIPSHPDVDPTSAAVIIRRLADWDRPETSAGALAMATLTGDVALRRWVRRDLADRGHTVPRWLADLHLAVPADRAVEVQGPFREVDAIVLGVSIPSGHTLTAVVQVDNELGARAIDSSLFEVPIEEVVPQLRAAEDAKPHRRDLSAADARARLTAATRDLYLNASPKPEQRWGAPRCLVRWMLSRFPEGGDATPPGSRDDVDLDELGLQFLASPWGRPWTRASLHVLVEEVLGRGLGNGLGDPLLWSPRHVGRLLDPELRGLDPELFDLDRLPELLRDLIRYGHGERGLRPELTDASLAAVDRWAPGFIAAVRSWDDEATA